MSIVELFDGPVLPWWVFAAVAFAVTTYLGYRNINLSSRVLVVLLTAEIAIVAILDVVIVARGGDHGLSTGIVDPHAITSGSLGIGLLFAIISYVGFEATAIFRDEARDPERTIPRATYVSLILIGVFYAVTSWALISGWGDDEAVARATDSGSTFLGDTAQRYLGTFGADVITVLYFTSLFACILSFHNVASRYVFALSQRDVLPASLSRPHAKHGSPHRASLWISGRRRDQRHPRRRVRTGPGRAVLHLVRRRHHGRHRDPSDRHQRRRPRLLRTRPARPLAMAGADRAEPRTGGTGRLADPDPHQPQGPRRRLKHSGVGDRRPAGGGVRSGCGDRHQGVRRHGRHGSLVTQTIDGHPPSPRRRERELLRGIDDGSLREIEVAWSDPFGHAAGKRIPAGLFLDRARGHGFAFCEAALGWNADATVIDSLQLTNWDGGYPDVFAVPDLATFRPLPWRPRVGHVISDIVTHDRTPSKLDPRAVLRGVLDQLAALGYTAKVGVELEFYLSNADGSPFQNDIHAYSLENANALEPLIGDLYEILSGFTRLEGIQTEYGPGQVETNLVYTDALEAADDSARLKYAVKEVARRHGKIASFMPKPFAEHSGSSAHLHISLWQDGAPAFAPVDGAENELTLHAIAGLLEHLPSITLFGAHSVNAYRRFEPDSFAPATVTWSRDNRSAAVRSLVEAAPRPTGSNCARADRMPTPTGWWRRRWLR